MTNQHVWEKIPIEGAIHLQSHSIPNMFAWPPFYNISHNKYGK